MVRAISASVEYAHGFHLALPRAPQDIRRIGDEKGRLL